MSNCKHERWLWLGVVELCSMFVFLWRGIYHALSFYLSSYTLLYRWPDFSFYDVTWTHMDFLKILNDVKVRSQWWPQYVKMMSWAPRTTLSQFKRIVCSFRDIATESGKKEMNSWKSWNRVKLGSLDYVTFFSTGVETNIFTLYQILKPFFWLASLISGLFRAT